MRKYWRFLVYITLRRLFGLHHAQKTAPGSAIARVYIFEAAENTLMMKLSQS